MCSGVILCHDFVQEDRESNENIVNLMLNDKDNGSIITQFLTLSCHTQKTWWEASATPTIDYL